MFVDVVTFAVAVTFFEAMVQDTRRGWGNHSLRAYFLMLYHRVLNLASFRHAIPGKCTECIKNSSRRASLPPGAIIDRPTEPFRTTNQLGGTSSSGV